MSSKLTGKVVLVVGGSSGMGLEVARQAASAGAQVHIAARNPEKMKKAMMAIEGNVISHMLNVGRENEVEALAEAIGKIDHVVITAADLVFKPFLQITNAEIEAVLAAKLWGAIYLVRHFANRINGEGSITLFGGTAAYKASAGGSIVAAINAAIDGFARTLAVELAPVRVNVISPGVVDTPVWDFIPAESRNAALTSIGASLPRGRVGKASELADAALFVMNNGFTTGTVLHIDGGANA